MTIKYFFKYNLIMLKEVLIFSLITTNIYNKSFILNSEEMKFIISFYNEQKIENIQNKFSNIEGFINFRKLDFINDEETNVVSAKFLTSNSEDIKKQINNFDFVESIEKVETLYNENNEINENILLSSFDERDYWKDLINLTKAQEITNETNNVKVAIIDTGVNINHNDLKGQIYEELSYGTDGMSPLIDNYGHGSKVAGILTGKQDNYMVDGIIKKGNIASIKLCEDGRKVDADNIVEAFNYAQSKNFDIVNFSYSFSSLSYYSSIKKSN